MCDRGHSPGVGCGAHSPPWSLTDFDAQIAHREGKRQPLSIAQIAEVMAVADALLDGQLYALIRRLGCACENPPVKRK